MEDSERGLTVGLSSCVGVDVREQYMAVVDLQGRQTEATTANRRVG